MRLEKDFALREIAGTWIVLPLGAATADFNGMLTLNESGVMLWRLLEQGCNRDDLAEALVCEYNVDYQQALNDVDQFVRKLASVGCIHL